MSIAASELGATRTVLLVPEPASLTAAAISTASSTAPPAAITSPGAPPPTSGRAQLAAGIPGGRLERRILGQDRSLELLKLASGLEPEFVDQLTPGDAVALKRLGLAPRSVQRDHQLTDQALARRMLAHQRLELPHQPCVLAEREPRVDSILQSAKPRLPKPGDLALREALVGEIGQRLAAPQRERLAQAPGRRPPRPRRRARFGRRPPAPQSGPRRRCPLVDREQVAVSPRQDHIVAERFAQLRDVALNDLDRARGSVLAPQLVDQPISREHLAAVNQQHSQQRTLLRAAQRERATVLRDLKRPKYSKVHARSNCWRPTATVLRKRPVVPDFLPSSDRHWPASYHRPARFREIRSQPAISEPKGVTMFRHHHISTSIALVLVLALAAAAPSAALAPPNPDPPAATAANIWPILDPPAPTAANIWPILDPPAATSQTQAPPAVNPHSRGAANPAVRAIQAQASSSRPGNRRTRLPRRQRTPEPAAALDHQGLRARRIRLGRRRHRRRSHHRTDPRSPGLSALRDPPAHRSPQPTKLIEQ